MKLGVSLVGPDGSLRPVALGGSASVVVAVTTKDDADARASIHLTGEPHRSGQVVEVNGARIPLPPSAFKRLLALVLAAATEAGPLQGDEFVRVGSDRADDGNTAALYRAILDLRRLIRPALGSDDDSAFILVANHRVQLAPGRFDLTWNRDALMQASEAVQKLSARLPHRPAAVE